MQEMPYCIRLDVQDLASGGGQNQMLLWKADVETSNPSLGLNLITVRTCLRLKCCSSTAALMQRFSKETTYADGRASPIDLGTPTPREVIDMSIGEALPST